MPLKEQGRGYARQQCVYEGPLGTKSKLSWSLETPHETSRRLSNRLRSYDNFCISNMAVSRYLGFLKFDSCTIR